MNDDIATSFSSALEPSCGGRIAPVSSAAQRRPIILVLGVHRSGTSLCSHLLSMLGVDMTDKIPGPGGTSPHPDNPRGHWERWEIVEFHDRILGFFNRGYFTPFHDFPLPAAWWADPRVAEVRREVIDFLGRRMGEGDFGFKDPRTVRLMPIWHQILRELKLTPKIVLCLRNPAQVARSLHQREGLDLDIGEYRWFTYMADFFRYSNSFDICTVEYEEWFDDPSINLAKLRNFLDLDWPHSDFDLNLTIADIVDGTLRHDDLRHREAGQPLVRSMYKLARRADHDTSAREQAQLIVSQLLSFQQLQKPFQRAFEDTVDRAAKLSEVEQKAAALRAALDERDAIMEAANERLVALDAKTETQRADVAVLQHERDDLAGALQAARAELGSSQGALASARQELSASHAMLREIERASGLLQTTLTERDSALAEMSRHADELAAMLQSAQAELSQRGEALSRAKAELFDRNATVSASQSEIDTLRIALGGAEQELATARAATQAEIAALHSALAAAREVGKAAFALLRDELSTAPQGPRSVRWLSLVLPRLGFARRTLPRIPASPG